ncbi:MAG: sugar nucleotide-binding protein [Rhodospirillales bacterium]|nr:sugar nucleotide-binding protein [Rhodospirillales bacterium]
MIENILIVGGDSMIGKALANLLRGQGKRVTVTTRRRETVSDDRIYLDLNPLPETLPAFPGADVWIFCAAISRLGDCAADLEQSHRINVEAPSFLAKADVTAGAHVLFLSSDKVFDGAIANRDAEDEPNPATAYGRQKAEAEKNILALGNGAGVVRFAKVLDRGSKLLAGWIESLNKGKEISAFGDMTMAPVPLALAVDILAAATDKKFSGVLQVSGPKDISYADAARHIAKGLGKDPELVLETSARNAGIPKEQTPPFTTMDSRRLESDLGFHVPEPFAMLDELYGLSEI